MLNKMIDAMRKFRARHKKRELRVLRFFRARTVMSNYGVRFVANYRDATFNFYIRAAYGFYYWNHISDISRDFVFLDIGANQGLYTICAAKNARCQRVYAFEPVPRVAELMRRNLALNMVDQRCQVIEKAISAESGQVDISVNDTHSGGASIAAGNPRIGNHRALTIETMDATGLETVVNAGNVPIYVKIDVEGHEGVVIQQLLKCAFAAKITEIFYEVDESWVNAPELQAILIAAGFELEQIGQGAHYDVMARRG